MNKKAIIIMDVMILKPMGYNQNGSQAGKANPMRGESDYWERGMFGEQNNLEIPEGLQCRS